MTEKFKPKYMDQETYDADCAILKTMASKIEKNISNELSKHNIGVVDLSTDSNKNITRNDCVGHALPFAIDHYELTPTEINKHARTITKAILKTFKSKTLVILNYRSYSHECPFFLSNSPFTFRLLMGVPFQRIKGVDKGICIELFGKTEE